MSLPLRMPYPPMEALLVDSIPNGEGWQYEPKWDGFRCLAFRDGDHITLQSKAGQPLTRYFPEAVEAVRRIKAKRFVLDGEIVVPVGSALSFDELLMRIHPAESRVRKLAHEHPATLIVFDLLVDERGRSLIGLPLRERRKRLEAFAERFFPSYANASPPSNGPKRRQIAPTAGAEAMILLSPATELCKQAEKWFRSTGGGLDGIVAKRLDDPYLPGERAMLKIKPIRTADCVVGGFRYAARGGVVGSLLLGLYDDEGVLDHVGFTSSLTAKDRTALTPKLEALIQPPGFTGRAPGGPSRWSNKRSMEWQPLAPKLVVEVQYDHFSGGRFRHGTRFLRWRPDKAPRQCTMDQVERQGRGLWPWLHRARLGA